MKTCCKVIFWQWSADYPCVQSRSFLFRAWPIDELHPGELLCSVPWRQPIKKLWLPQTLPTIKLATHRCRQALLWYARLWVLLCTYFYLFTFMLTTLHTVPTRDYNLQMFYLSLIKQHLVPGYVPCYFLKCISGPVHEFLKRLTVRV